MKNIFHLVLIFFSMTLLLAPLTHAQGNITGIAQLTLTDEKTVYPDRLRVLLVRSQAEVPNSPDLEHMDKFKRIEAIRNLHMIFFLNVREKMSDPKYVVQSTLTTPNGTFFFFDIPYGNYFILITFPAMIENYKVAWQVPITVKGHETTPIELNNENLAVPTYSRY